MDIGVLTSPISEGTGAKVRRCSTCGETKQVSEYAKRSLLTGALHARCRTCVAAYHARWYARNRDRVMARVHQRTDRLVHEHRKRLLAWLRMHPCVDCGEPDPIVLEFDHVFGEKRSEVSELVKAGGSWQAIANEIAKCEVRCVNCHKRKTEERRQKGRRS